MSDQRPKAAARQITAFAGRAVPTAELAGLVDLAARLRPVFERCDAGDVDGAARLVNELLRRYDSAPQLIRHDDAPWHLHFHSERAGMADGYGAGCATGLAMVIGGGDAERLGVCTSAPCDRVFVDTSRNGNRRFCSPRCANRAGVVAFRARERNRGRAGLTE